MRDRYLDTIESKPIGYYRSNEICGTNRKIGLQPITRRRKSRIRMRKLLYPIDGREAIFLQHYVLYFQRSAWHSPDPLFHFRECKKRTNTFIIRAGELR